MRLSVMEQNKISIIVPVFNAERTLKKCLDSIRQQTYSNYQVILVDDGSTDSSGGICDDYAKLDSRFIAFHNTNAGVSATRNFGIEQAVGERLAFIDSDDYIECDYLASMVSYDHDLVVTGYSTFGDSIDTYLPHNLELFHGKNIDEEFVYMMDYLYIRAPWCKLFNTKIIKDNNLKFNRTLKIGEDSEFVFHYLLLCNSIKLISYSGYRYYIFKGNFEKKYGLCTESYFEHIIAIRTVLTKLESKWHINLLSVKEWFDGFYYGVWFCFLGGCGYSTLKKSVSMYLKMGGRKPTKPLRRRLLFDLLCHSPYFVYLLFQIRKSLK